MTEYNIFNQPFSKGTGADNRGGSSDLFRSGAEVGRENLQQAAKDAKTSKNLQYAQAGADLFSSAMNYFDVKSKGRVYESQKSMIDANMANQESYLVDRLNDNMAQLDAFTAAKNVDIRSQAVTSSKQGAAIDMGDDINAQRRQTNLQKIGLDLQYAMEKQAAKTALISSAVSTAAMAFSDRRLKENLIKVGKLNNGLDVYIGNYTDKAIELDNNLTKTPQLFLIAQEVQEIKPDAVGEKNGYLAVDYAKAVKE